MSPIIPLYQRTDLEPVDSLLCKEIYNHCYHCISEQVLDGSKEKVFIFLELDRVLIEDRFSGGLQKKIKRIAKELNNNFKDPTEYHWTRAKGQCLDGEAADRLESLLYHIQSNKREPVIVIASDWRNDATLLQLKEQVFKDYEFGSFIGGKLCHLDYQSSFAPECKAFSNFCRISRTPLKTHSDAIEDWLQTHGFPINHPFVILSNYEWDFRDRFKDRTIITDYKLSWKNVDKAREMLTPNQ